jgi:hypothetical protein
MSETVMLILILVGIVFAGFLIFFVASLVRFWGYKDYGPIWEKVETVVGGKVKKPFSIFNGNIEIEGTVDDIKILFRSMSSQFIYRGYQLIGYSSKIPAPKWHTLVTIEYDENVVIHANEFALELDPDIFETDRYDSSTFKEKIDYLVNIVRKHERHITSA